MNFASLFGQPMAVRTVVAAGSTITDATSLTPFSEVIYHVTGANGAKGVKLPKIPATVGGKFVIIQNNDAAILLVYPPTGTAIDGGSTNAAFSQTASSSCVFFCDKTQWHSLSSASGGSASSTLTSAHIFVGNGSNVATDTAVTGDVAITNAGVTSIAAGLTTAKAASGVAAGYKVARGITALDGSNPTPVATGLTTVVAATVTLEGNSAPGVGTSVLTLDPANYATGALSVYAWKVTSNANPTLIASTGTENFEWVAVGT